MRRTIAAIALLLSAGAACAALAQEQESDLRAPPAAAPTPSEPRTPPVPKVPPQPPGWPGADGLGLLDDPRTWIDTEGDSRVSRATREDREDRRELRDLRRFGWVLPQDALPPPRATKKPRNHSPAKPARAVR